MLLSNLPRSYLKTALASCALIPTGPLIALLALHLHPHVLGEIVATFGVLLTLAALALAASGAIVMVRFRRAERGERDLFLELNRSRSPSALIAGPPPRVSALRRWLARAMLGHELVVGDLVRIKPWAEIRATLDEKGRLGELSFMPEMLAMCGRRAHVYRCIHRLFDYRKSRRMRHMDGTVLLVGATCNGASHGGCEAACHTIWKAEWLERVDAEAEPRPAQNTPPTDTAVLQFGTQAPRYSCQLTQLNAASQPIEPLNPVDFFRPLISGNVTPRAFAVAWLTYLFNTLQQIRHGVGYPMFEAPVSPGTARDETPLAAGDRVVVRSAAEIRATLNAQQMNRGLWFEPDMLKHCGEHHRVESEIRTLIDIVSGEIRTIKTPAYILDDVRFSGERQLFNAQHEPLYWRGVWLRRDED